MKAQCFVVLLATGAWVATAGVTAAAERAGGVQVDVDRAGVRVDVETKVDRASAGRQGFGCDRSERVQPQQ